MEVRRARRTDFKQILDFLERYHETSNLASVRFVRQDMAKVLDAYLSSRDCIGLVAEKDDGTLCGTLFGSLQPFMFNKSKVWATDLFFISDGGGPMLLRKFKEWAFGVGAERIVMRISSGHDRAGKLIELSGGEPTGGMYVFRR